MARALSEVKQRDSELNIFLSRFLRAQDSSAFTTDELAILVSSFSRKSVLDGSLYRFFAGLPLSSHSSLSLPVLTFLSSPLLSSPPSLYPRCISFSSFPLFPSFCFLCLTLPELLSTVSLPLPLRSSPPSSSLPTSLSSFSSCPSLSSLVHHALVSFPHSSQAVSCSILCLISLPKTSQPSCMVTPRLVYGRRRYQHHVGRQIVKPDFDI